jgi:hypothetical protein
MEEIGPAAVGCPSNRDEAYAGRPGLRDDNSAAFAGRKPFSALFGNQHQRGFHQHQQLKRRVVP